MSYLPRSATFIHTTVCCHQSYKPVVYAERTENLDEFPFADLRRLVVPNASLSARLRRRLHARVDGFASAFQHQLAVHAERDGCDLLHAHFGWTGAAAVRAAARVGIPLVTTFYGRDLSDDRGHPYDALFARGAVFLCEGPFMAKQLEALGCSAEKIRVLPIPVDLTKFPFRSRRLPTEPLVLVQACRFVEKKGVDLSIRAFAAASARLGAAELWLIGDGELRRNLEDLVAELAVSTRVRFLGMLSHGEYREVLQRAHLCLQPSRTASDGDSEGGAPTVILEMQAVGIPVVATRHADIPFVAAEPDRLAAEEDVDSLADELVRFANLSEDEWGARAALGRSIVEAQHDSRTIVRSLERIYGEVVAAGTGLPGARGSEPLHA